MNAVDAWKNNHLVLVPVSRVCLCEICVCVTLSFCGHLYLKVIFSIFF